MDGVRPGTVELALPAGRQSRTPGVHRLQSLTAIDVTRHANLPITTISRTLADLGGAVSPTAVERATEWALRNRLVGLAELEQVSQRLAKSGGHGLAKVLAQRPEASPPTESDAETLFVQLVRRGGYPDPIRQYAVLLRGRRYRLDFAWPELRLAVEIDGAGVHGPDALSADLRRQNRIILDGWLILRFTWDELVRGWREVEEDLRAAWRLRGAFVPSP
jgi:very-short-patch-repair endonuclease